MTPKRLTKNDGSLADVPSVEPSAPIPLMNPTTNRCPRCLRGAIIGRIGEASCFQCGYEPVTASDYASAEAYLAAVNSGEITGRKRTAPGERA